MGLESLALSILPSFRTAASAMLILGGGLCAVHAWQGWRRVETALREQRPLPSSVMLALLPAVLLVVAVLVLLGLVLQ